MTSDRVTENEVNYVVWRYLQESGFGEAAVKLQRDWKVNPQDLPFAAFVKTHALVNLIHKGLQYTELETTLIQNGRCRGPPEYIFGPPSSLQVQPQDDRGGHRSDEPEREGDPMQIDVRQPNGFPLNSVSSTTTTTTHAPPTPLHLPPPPPPPPPAPPVILRTTTSGPSVSTQMEPILELAAAANKTSVLQTETSHVLHCVWNPVDPTCLATAGTETLTRIWKIVDPSTEDAAQSSSPPAAAVANHVEININDGHSWYPTQLDWNPSGTWLALAAYNSDDIFDNRVTIWSKDGFIQVVIMPAYKPVLIMRWSPSGSWLLGVCTDDTSSDVKIWDPVTGDAIHNIEYRDPLEYAMWLDDDEFFVAGGSLLESVRIDKRKCATRNIQVRPQDGSWWRIDLTTHRIATAASDVKVEVYKEDEQLHCFEGHTGTITALEWQPLKDGKLKKGEPRRLATGSTDGTIQIANALPPYQNLRVYPFGRSRLPIAAMAFSPDGRFIAGTSMGKVLIWDVNSGSSIPRASWELKETPQTMMSNNGVGVTNGDHQPSPNDHNKAMDVQTTQQQGEGQNEEENEMSDSLLAWNTDGTKLALAHKNQIAIIRVPHLTTTS